MTRFCCCCNGDELITSRNKFERAPEPTDVYWDNLNVSYFKRLRNVILTYLATIIVIGGCFGVIYGINVAKNNLNN